MIAKEEQTAGHLLEPTGGGIATPPAFGGSDAHA